MDPQNPPTMMPDSTKVMVLSRLSSLGMVTVQATAPRPPAKAAPCTPKAPQPARMAAAAPMHAPDETPRRSGDTSGLRNMP